MSQVYTGPQNNWSNSRNKIKNKVYLKLKNPAPCLRKFPGHRFLDADRIFCRSFLCTFVLFLHSPQHLLVATGGKKTRGCSWACGWCCTALPMQTCSSHSSGCRALASCPAWENIFQSDRELGKYNGHKVILQEYSYFLSSPTFCCIYSTVSKGRESKDQPERGILRKRC